MSDRLTPQERSLLMGKIRGKANRSTEGVLGKLLRLGRVVGWRTQQKLPGRPDFSFRKEKVAIFVDGCFWHGCPQHYRLPQSNVEFWEAKITRNRRRDRRDTRALKARGWRVVRIWEHDLRPARREKTLARILRVLAEAVDESPARFRRTARSRQTADS
jgi:DNA mismatch endonuclease (patch repair protein)